VVSDTEIQNEPEIEILDGPSLEESGREETPAPAAEEAPAPASAEPAAAEPAPSVDDGIAELKQRLAAAERARADAAEEARRAREETQSSNLSLLKGAIEARKQARETLKAQFVDAGRAGDFDTQAEIAASMAEIASEIKQLEAGRQSLESAPRQQPVQHSDPAEALARQMESAGSHRSASWIREHAEFARDPQKYQKMLAAHNLAVADGIAPDTDAYFESVESTLKIRPQAAAPAPAPTREAPPPAAPVGRSAATVGNGAVEGGKRITLTRAEVEAAEAAGITPQEYARNKLRLKNEGRM
jgi:hypothetical protein